LTTEPVTDAAVETAEAPVLTTAPATDTTAQAGKAQQHSATAIKCRGSGKRDFTDIGVSSSEEMQAQIVPLLQADRHSGNKR